MKIKVVTDVKNINSYARKLFVYDTVFIDEGLYLRFYECNTVANISHEEYPAVSGLIHQSP